MPPRTMAFRAEAVFRQKQQKAQESGLKEDRRTRTSYDQRLANYAASKPRERDHWCRTEIHGELPVTTPMES